MFENQWKTNNKVQEVIIDTNCLRITTHEHKPRRIKLIRINTNYRHLIKADKNFKTKDK